MILQNLFDLGLSDANMELIFVLIVVILTMIIAKMFNLFHYEIILILFAFIVTLLYAFDCVSVVTLVFSYILLGVWLYIITHLNSQNSSGVNTE